MGGMEGVEQWDKQKRNPTESFHFDPNKEIDPVEKLIEERGGSTEAFDELMDRLDENPGDVEARRQATLLVNRLEDFANRLKQKIQH